MTLVQMIGTDLKTKRMQQPLATNAEHDLLLEPIALVAAIEAVRDGPVRGMVMLNVGVEEEHGRLVADRTGQDVEPRTDPDRASLEVEAMKAA